MHFLTLACLLPYSPHRIKSWWFSIEFIILLRFCFGAILVELPQILFNFDKDRIKLKVLEVPRSCCDLSQLINELVSNSQWRRVHASGVILSDKNFWHINFLTKTLGVGFGTPSWCLVRQLTRPSLALWGDVWFSSLRIRLRLHPTTLDLEKKISWSGWISRWIFVSCSTEDRALWVPKPKGVENFYLSTERKSFFDLEFEEEEEDRAAFSMSRHFDDASMMGH